MVKDCIFCKIVNREIPAEIVYESEFFLGFLDINPVNEGHVLVIPKKHCDNMLHCDDDVISEIFVECKNLMCAIKKSLNADYVALSVVGVDVPHFHVHLIPRYFDDGLSDFWPTKKYSEGESRRIADLLKSALQNGSGED